MNTKRIVLATALFAVVSVAPPSPTQAQSKTLASTMNVYVFPTQGQHTNQQSVDEAECYNWAVSNTGVDPFQLQKQMQEQQKQAEAAKQQGAASTQGSAVRGAAAGAATGAVFGAITGNAGKGAAIGAASGAVLNRARHRGAAEATTQAANQQTAATQKATADQIENFKKAFSVCLEAKKYMVKYLAVVREAAAALAGAMPSSRGEAIVVRRDTGI